MTKIIEILTLLAILALVGLFGMLVRIQQVSAPNDVELYDLYAKIHMLDEQTDMLACQVRCLANIPMYLEIDRYECEEKCQLEN